MASTKIIYGIDLGTTNSAICRMDKGEPTIIKSDTLKDTMPSCVSFTKKGALKVGDVAYNAMKSDKKRATKTWKKEDSNTYLEFKRTMGTTTHYHSSFKNENFSSEQLSSEILKTLKSFETSENISSVVITVPAKFTVNQKTATLEAAKLAGFKHCELLQEPIAAAMAYGLTSEEKNGIWMVFDFGGGTFDAALLKVEDGIMQVFDTEGDNYLGGKNLDYAIVDRIIIPYLRENYALDNILADVDKKEVLRDAMKTFAEDAKNQLSFKVQEEITSDIGELGEDDDGEELEVDITFKQKEVFDVMRPYFQKAIDICKDLLSRNNLTPSQINKIIPVGGPTHSPLIRQMLKEQLTANVENNIDPMTAVATGAALYASTLDTEVEEESIAFDTVRLEVGYESTSVETTEWISIKLPKESELDSVSVELLRSDKAWSSGRTEIDKIGNVIETNLTEGKPNSFEVLCYDKYGNTIPCFPSEITIIQGSKVGAAPLPYNIGIGVWDSDREKEVFNMARGLEKNKPVPAIGVVNGKKTPSQLRPGIETDILKIPVYQTDDFKEAEGRPTSLFEYVSDVIITGDDIDVLIPANSEADITLKVDTSEQMTIEVHFPATDCTVEKKLDTNKKQSIEEAENAIRKGLTEARRSINTLKSIGTETRELEQRLQLVREEEANSSEKKMVLQHLKEVLREIDKLDKGTEFQRLETELRNEFDKLEKAQGQEGDNKTLQMVNQLRSQVDQAIRTQNVQIGREILKQIRHLYVQLTMLYQCMNIIEYYNSNFNSQVWKDTSRARLLINKGMEIIHNNPSTEALHPIAVGILKLLPEDNLREGNEILHL